MRTCYRLFSLLLMAGLAGCATKAPPVPPAPQPPVAVQSSPAAPQQASETPRGVPAVPPLSSTAFFTQTGLASFYGGAHDGKTTARGGIFDHRDLTAAHRTLPFGTMVRVTNLSNGRTVSVEITDRGPRIKTRIIDISLAAAREIGMQKKGITRVRVDAFRADRPGQN
jgi:rare lipoprotein A